MHVVKALPGPSLTHDNTNHGCSLRCLRVRLAVPDARGGLKVPVDGQASRQGC